MIFLKKMNGSLKYERLEINENKNRCSFEEENEDFFPIKEKFFIKEENDTSICDIEKRILDKKHIIVLQSIRDIKLGITNEEYPIILFETNKDEENPNTSISNRIFNDINFIVHKTLHKKKKLYGNECIFYDDLNKQVIKQKENLDYHDIDQFIGELKEQNKYFEFIAIKSIMISITNLMTESIKNYLVRNETFINNIINEENKEDKNFDFEFINIFEDIYNDFVYQSNLCPDIEVYFNSSLDNFRNKYQMNFTLSELFTDIFWNSIFHNKKLCTLFYECYYNDEVYGDARLYLNKILNAIFGVNIPLKHQIVELLGLHELENNEKNDLMTLIVNQKNKYHSELIKLEIEKDNLNKENNKKTEEENNSNINNNKINEKNNNIITNNINIKSLNLENIKGNVIKANDISVLKHKKSNNLSINNTNNNVILNAENSTEKQKENKDKEKEENYKNYLNKNNNNNNDNDTIMDLEHKTVDEIYNYINDDKIVKNKRKKKSRKNKKVKKEEIIIEDNQEEIEDSIVMQFKKDLSDKFIHARSITKIRPVISKEWINIISNNNLK